MDTEHRMGIGDNFVCGVYAVNYRKRCFSDRRYFDKRDRLSDRNHSFCDCRMLCNKTKYEKINACLLRISKHAFSLMHFFPNVRPVPGKC